MSKTKKATEFTTDDFRDPEKLRWFLTEVGFGFQGISKENQQFVMGILPWLSFNNVRPLLDVYKEVCGKEAANRAREYLIKSLDGFEI